MSDALNSAVRSLVSLIDVAKADSVHKFRATMQVQVATLRLLIKAGVGSIDDAIAEIEAVGEEFREVFGKDEIATGAEWAKDLLRGQVPLHGSIVQRALQRMERVRTPGGEEIVVHNVSDFWKGSN